MRILTGPLSREEGHIFRLIQAADPDGTRTFADDGRPFQTVLAELPAGWEPDFVVFWTPEYREVPAGLDECPYPLVFVVDDWNLALSAYLKVLRMADAIVTDPGGVEALRRWGFAQVHFWPAHAWDPDRTDPGEVADFDYDVCFIGNLHQEIHGSRNRYLARLTQLSERHRIAILSNVWGEAYGKVLRRSRVIFNHAVRGEMNVRIYEAAAAGRPVLVERDNLEIGRCLQDGIEYLSYDETDFETQLEALLADPARCERIGAAAQARLQRESYGQHWLSLKTLLGSLSWPDPATRGWWQLPEHERARLRARQAQSTLTPGALERAWHWIKEANALAPDDPLVAHGYAVCTAWRSQSDPEKHAAYRHKAIEHFQRLLTREPGYALAWLNLGNLLAANEALDKAEVIWRHGLQALEGEVVLEPTDFHLPAKYDYFRLGWERGCANQDAAGLHRLLYSQLAHRVGMAVYRRDLPQEARPYFEAAVAADPTNGRAWYDLGCSASGRAAVVAWQRCLALQPFHFEARRNLISALAQLGQRAEAQQLLAETERIITAIPFFAAARPPFNQLRQDLAR